MDTRPIIFYHSVDNDGQLSGYLVNSLLCEGKAIYRPINYGQEIDWEEVEGREVYMVDFTLQPFSKMVALNGCCNLTWIDHHESEIKKHGDYPHIEIAGLRRSGVAACELVWEYAGNDDLTMPKVVDYVSHYDTFRLTHPDYLHFQLGSETHKTDPGKGSSFWKAVLSSNDIFESIIEQGKVIRRYNERDNKEYCDNFAFEVEFEGITFLAVNRLFVQTRFFLGVFDTEKHQACMGFGFRGDHYSIHMYHDDKEKGPNLSEIASKHGGGGHRGAAAFQCNELPFELPFKDM